MKKPPDHRRTLRSDPAFLQDLLAQPKQILDSLEMADSEGNGESLGAVDVIYDQTGMVAIQGLSLRCRSTRNMNGYIYHSFALHYRLPPPIIHRDVLAQLEIEPADKASHREPGQPAIYGAHIVLVNFTEKIPDNRHYDWYNWLKVFEQRTNLQVNAKRRGPFEGLLI